MLINRSKSPANAAPQQLYAAAETTSVAKKVAPDQGLVEALRTAVSERAPQGGEGLSSPRMALAKLLRVFSARADDSVQRDMKAIAAKVCGEVTLVATYSSATREAAAQVALKGWTELTRDLSARR